MPCSKFNFSRSTCTHVDIGFDFALNLTSTDANGTAIDLSGFSFSAVIKSARNGSTILSLSTVGNDTSTGFYMADPTTGIVKLTITRADSALFTEGNYPYEITRTSPSNLNTLWLQGTIDFSEGTA